MSAPLNIIIAGHVDHGKSSLIGRLLYACGALEDGKIDAIRTACNRRGESFEWAFVTDALRQERSQGITLEASHIVLRTPHRNWRLIDAPGHRELLGNMLTGATHADAALLVIDAKEGIGEQTVRHLQLLHVLGISQLAVAVNKIDELGYDERRFRPLEAQIVALLQQTGYENAPIIPVSAQSGEGILQADGPLYWHRGPALLPALDAFSPAMPDSDAPLRFLVQDIYKLDQRRIVIGRVESGRLAVGDTLLWLPSGEQAMVSTIERWPHSQAKEACAGESIGLTLDSPLLIERGMVACREDSAPMLTNRFRLRLFWLGEQPLEPGARAVLRLGTAETMADVIAIERSDNATAHQVEYGELAEVLVRTRALLAVDDYRRLRALGRAVLVQEGAVVAGGVVATDGFYDQRQLKEWQTSPSLLEPVIAGDERARVNHHRGGVIWFTGLPGAGKSTVAREAERRLFAKGIQVCVLDGDQLRAGLSRDLGFTPEDRRENIRRAAEVAVMMARAGLVVLVAMISPAREDRRRARAIAPELFHNIYLNAPLSVCERRDPKGLYKKARAGALPHFTGVGAPYEPPEHSDLVLESGSASIDDCAHALVEYIERQLVEPVGNA